MTEPYLVMEKVIKGESKFFPLDLSCESLFANDWFIVAFFLFKFERKWSV